MLEIIRKLNRIELLKPGGLYKILSSIFIIGPNLLALLRYAAVQFPKRTAIVDENEQITFKELYLQAYRLSASIHKKYNLTKGKKVALICRNHVSFVKSIFAVSGTGADLYLFNIEMNREQFDSIISKIDFSLFIYDEEITDYIKYRNLEQKSLPSYNNTGHSADFYSKEAATEKIKLKADGNKIVVLSGGTSGNFKEAERKPSVFKFINPFFALLSRLNLDKYRSAYLATPFYHGFGFSALIISVILGVKIFITKKFIASESCSMINKNKIELTTLVPLMLRRMIGHDYCSLSSLKCIISGGAELSMNLAGVAFSKLGNIIFNLYGTSEAGFSVLAAPEDIIKYPSTIGKCIRGVKIKILNYRNEPVVPGEKGRICIANNWSMINKEKSFVDTGDIGFMNSNGYLFLSGRADDMIISGGENVYPVELENILNNHNEISESAVIGIDDTEFSKRLKAYIVRKNSSKITTEELFTWLSHKAARYQIPSQIEFIHEIPYTSIGKPDKKALMELNKQ